MASRPGTSRRGVDAVRALALAGLAACSASAWAGGHLDVDDSGTVDPGRCQYEAWTGRYGAAPATRVQHLGPACRIGVFEVGLNIDRLAVPVEGRDFVGLVLGPQLKWQFWGTADSEWSAAVSATASFEVHHREGRPGGQFLLPLTWHPDPSLYVHANYGADWLLVSGARFARGGLGVEWAFSEKVSLIAERFKSFGSWTSRAGFRYNLTPTISVDLTASRTTPSPSLANSTDSLAGLRHARGFILGINHEFGRP